MLWWMLVPEAQLGRRLEPCLNRIKVRPIDWSDPYSFYLLVPLTKPLEPVSCR